MHRSNATRTAPSAWHARWAVGLLAIASLTSCDKAREPEIVPASVVMPGTEAPTPASPPISATTPMVPAPAAIGAAPAPATPSTGTSLTGGSVSVIAGPLPASTPPSPSPSPVVVEIPSAGLPPRPTASLPGSASIGPQTASSAPAESQPPSVSPGTTR